MSYDPLDPEADPFRPPVIPTGVCCLHCQQEYESYQIEWRVKNGVDGKPHGFWCCPTPGCDGAGFGFDILPTDPEYSDERGGWVDTDDDEDDEEWEDEEDGEEDEEADPPDNGLGHPRRPDDDGEIPF